MQELESLSQDPKACLIVVDMQPDFYPSGALPVPGGDEIVAGVAKQVEAFENVIFTQDSHPKPHISFASSFEGRKPLETMTLQEVEEGKVYSPHFSKEELQFYLQQTTNAAQVLWPDHCVIGTENWKIDKRLNTDKAQLVLRKGWRSTAHSYSAFTEDDGMPTGLTSYLKELQLQKVVVIGLAGDYCVGFSAQDSANAGFETYLVEPLTRYVNFPEGSREQTLRRLEYLGVKILDL